MEYGSDDEHHIMQYHEPELVGGYALSETEGIVGFVVYNTGNGYIAYDRCNTVNLKKNAS